MKATKSLFASLVLLTACGSVSPSSDDSSDEPPADAGADPDAADSQPDAPGEQLPFLVDSLVPGHLPPQLSSVTYSSPALIQLIRPTATTATVSVLEQRIVPTTTGPLTVKVELSRPTSTYSRSIATFYEAPIEAWFPIQFLCSENNVSTNDPRCSTQAPVAALADATGEVADSRWRVYIIDENTGLAVDGCVETGMQVECVLPNPSGAAYRIVVAADGFAQLWRPELSLKELSTLIGPMIGAYLPQRVVCKHFTAEAGSSRVWCDGYDTYIGYVGFDSASLAIDPIQLTITSGTASATFTGPATTWSPGNNDLPGDPY